MERLNPLNDYLFLKIMGEPGDEEQCLAFLNAVLADSRQEPLRLVKIVENRSLSPEQLGSKAAVLDLRALAETDARKNIKVNVEVQLKDLRNMTERSLYYWAREYAAGIKEGEDYGELPRVVTVNIVNFDHVKLERFHTSFHLREDSRPEYVLTEMLEIHFLNMVRFRRLKGKGGGKSPLERWLTFFDERATEAELREAIGMEAAIGKAQTRLEQVTRDNEFMHNYTLRVMAMSDLTTMRNTAFEQGVKQGIEKGIEKGSIDIAKRALAKGLPAEVVQDLTGLSAEEIAALQSEKL